MTRTAEQRYASLWSLARPISENRNAQ